MRIAEIEQEDLRQLPVLLVVDVLDEVGLQFFYFREALWQLEDDEQPEIADNSDTRGDIQKQD